MWAMAHGRFAMLALAITAMAVALAPSPCAAYNITKILADHPDLSQFNKMLTETRLASEINRRRTITVLAVDNAGMAPLTGGHFSLRTIRHILSMHVLVDYYGSKKLHQLAHGATASSSMFQATGAAPGTTGYVNITLHRGGHVTFTAEDAADSATPSNFVKSIKEIPYDLSVLQISKVLSSPEAEAPVPPPGPVNLTELLSKKYCKAFAGLLASNADVFRAINETKDNGLTLFCPVDSAVASFMPKYKNLTAKAKTAILLYHAVPDYYSIQLLKSNNGMVTTLATASVAKKDYSYDVQNDDETVTLETKVVTSTVTATVKDDDPLAVFAVSKFLQPKELYKTTEPLAPAPAPASPKKKSKKKPRTAAASPDDDTAADSPDDSPADDEADKTGAAPAMLARWMTVAATVAAALALVA